MAEEVRFELTDRYKAIDGLANRSHQPSSGTPPNSV
jgi:hypothetical protein